MKFLRFFLLIALASPAPALACSCRLDGRTLEGRIDDAVRVVRVRVVAAELVGERPEQFVSTFESGERIAYKLRALESLKGGDAALPVLLGLAGTGGGDCTERLSIGQEVLLFVEGETQQLDFSFCARPYATLEGSAELDLRLPAAREFIRDRTPIHECENILTLSPPEQATACRKRRADLQREASRSMREQR